MKQIINRIHYNNQKWFFFLKFLLYIASFFYLFIIKIKNLLYSVHILKEKSVEAYVICVGNLTTGGVGKTPVVCEISNHLSNMGKKVAIISRGYKGKLNNKKPNIIKDFSKILINDPLLCGDEPYMIAKNTENVAVITCKDRFKASRCAIELGAEYIVMDDGFSNRKIKKNLVLLLIDSKKQFGNRHVLPYGPLREPLSEIKRADKIILINKNDKECCELNLKNIINKEILKCDFVKDFYYEIKEKNAVSPNKDMKVCAFCGIGQPERFFNYVKEDFCLERTYSFDDHHSYTNNEILGLSQKNKTLVTTQKDEVKLENIAKNIDGEILVLKLKTNLDIGKIIYEK